ncbi:TonB-dependent receptor [Vibrio coralliilyticus]|uniref:TonB-dependent receptor n=1 Tax=Vibrio coralliilyticus TaxID=190893 RepID=UPI001560C29A|nr:TonB-dependent receptor [Vibrio coralliilyticus]NRF32936.1 TonB-dependent receptor [Vibrio coralliilyticus]NRF55324.1 TonB-dependent receptor [Vibrio coralliilyticus]NRG04756.1 TonB-dependent receptor [Vibrio coralliilyticus]
MNRSILAIAVASLLPHASLSYAQEASADETMVVLARSDFNNSIEDIPANVTIISSEDIAASGAKSLDTLLRARAGIQISDTNSGPAFAIRGFTGGQAANNTLILVDGRRLNKQDLSAPQVSSILISQIERIEVLSGSAGVLYGDQAVGGVINIITKGASEDGGSVSVSAGNFDSYAGSVNVSRKLDEQWSLFVSASQDNTDNYRDHNKRETGSLLGRIGYELDKTEFFAEASYYDNNREYAGSLTEEQYEQDPTQVNPSNQTDYSHEITKALRAGYKRSLTNTWLFGTDVIYDNTSGSGSAWGSSTTSSSKQLVGSVKVENQFSNQSGQGNVLIGLEAADRDHSYKSSSTNRANEQVTYSAYGQVSYPLVPRLSLTTGARYSSVEDKLFDGAVYPNTEKLSESQDAYELGLNFKISETQRLYLRGATNFRFAKIDEQAYTSPGVLGLKPQTGNSIEAGWGLTEDDYSVKIDVYNLQLEDEIVFDSSAPTPVGGSFAGANVNADESERNGINVSGDYYATESVLLGIEYSFINAEFSNGDNKGKELPWVSPHSGRAYVTYDVNYNWQFYVEGVYTGARYKDGDTSNSVEKLSAYWLNNIAINYTQDVWSASLRLDNAFDEKYPANANNYGAYYPGDGRKVMITGSYQF